jgi:putative copper export protein
VEAEIMAAPVKVASLVLSAVFLCGVPALAAPGLAAVPAGGGEEVFTPAVLRAVFTEAGGTEVYVRLKLLITGGDLPFTTLTFRVRDPALLEGLGEGARVAFRAVRIDGENTVVAIRPGS